MQKDDLASRLAKTNGISKAKAADQLDRVVHQILRKLRSGKPAKMPGLGVLVPGSDTRLKQERPGGRRGCR